MSQNTPEQRNPRGAATEPGIDLNEDFIEERGCKFLGINETRATRLESRAAASEAQGAHVKVHGADASSKRGKCQSFVQ